MIADVMRHLGLISGIADMLTHLGLISGQVASVSETIGDARPKTWNDCLAWGRKRSPRYSRYRS